MRGLRRAYGGMPDSDLAVRALLAARPGAADLEVVAHGLEDAFVRITAS